MIILQRLIQRRTAVVNDNDNAITWKFNTHTHTEHLSSLLAYTGISVCCNRIVWVARAEKKL